MASPGIARRAIMKPKWLRRLGDEMNLRLSRIAKEVKPWRAHIGT